MTKIKHLGPAKKYQEMLRRYCLWYYNDGYMLSHIFSECIENVPERVNPMNFEWLYCISVCSFLVKHVTFRCVILIMGGTGCVEVGDIWEISSPSLQFCYKSKSLKNIFKERNGNIFDGLDQFWLFSSA